MGASGKAEICVIFDTKEQAKKYEVILKDFQNKVKEHYKTKVAPNYEGSVDTSIRYNSIDRGDNIVEFELYSTRPDNLEWQVHYAIHFAKEVGGVDEFQTTMWIVSDASRSFDSEEINDFEPNLK